MDSLQHGTRGGAKPDDDATQSFLKGLLYLNSVEVKEDVTRGAGLVTAAAEAGLPEAMLLLANMYGEGDKVEPDHDKAAFWRERFCECRKESSDETYLGALASLDGLARSLSKLGNHLGASKLAREVYRLRCEMLGEKHPDTLLSLCNLAASRNRVGHYWGAIRHYEKAWELYRETLGEDHPRALACLRNLARTYRRLGDDRMAMRRAVELTQLYEKLRHRLYEF